MSFSDLKEFFENPLFRADGLKIYPTLVIRGTDLCELWKTGRYRSYHPNTLMDLVARILALAPPWTLSHGNGYFISQENPDDYAHRVQHKAGDFDFIPEDIQKEICDFARNKFWPAVLKYFGNTFPFVI